MNFVQLVEVGPHPIAGRFTFPVLWRVGKVPCLHLRSLDIAIALLSWRLALEREMIKVEVEVCLLLVGG